MIYTIQQRVTKTTEKLLTYEVSANNVAEALENLKNDKCRFIKSSTVGRNTTEQSAKIIDSKKDIFD